jgi:hypothetical protein
MWSSLVTDVVISDDNLVHLPGSVVCMTASEMTASVMSGLVMIYAQAMADGCVRGERVAYARTATR